MVSSVLISVQFHNHTPCILFNSYPAAINPTVLSLLNMIRMVSGCFVISLFSSCCYRQGIYLSPQNANSNPYHSIPMKFDSLRSAIYVNAVFSNGSANDQAADQVTAFQGSVHRSSNFSIFQAYYGANLTLGSYNVSDYQNSSDFYGGYGGSLINDSLNYIHHSSYFFGSYGISGGINIVTTHQHIRKYRHSEWRILGLETSLQKEFGKYSDFRDQLPDTAANIIFRKHFSAYLGLYTEWLWTNKHKTELGFKMAVGTDLSPGSNYSHYLAPSILPLHCFSITYHVKKGHITGYIQTNFGSYADNIQFGLSYRLGK